MPRTRPRGRPQRRSKAARWAVIAAVLLVMLGLTFGFGLFVGRHRLWQAHPAAAADTARKTPPSSRRGGLTETGTDRPPQLQEKLTFYQTLKTPIGPVRTTEDVHASAKPAGATTSPARAPEGASDGTTPRTTDHAGQEPPTLASAQSKSGSERPEARGGPSAPREGRRPEASAEWTVQVGVFSSAQQAAGVMKQLAAGGFEAQVAPTTTSNGQVRYRVRLGSYTSKEEADRTAERVRLARSLPTFVTTR